MSYLIDTNVILRLFDLNDPRNAEVVAALDTLTKHTEQIYVCAQVIIEYWSVSTRPKEANGMGLSIAEADNKLNNIEKLFPCIPEPSDIARHWRQVVKEYGVYGKQAHDARIAALMLAQNISYLLTLNPGDFDRYHGITPITPLEVVQQTDTQV